MTAQIYKVKLNGISLYHKQLDALVTLEELLPPEHYRVVSLYGTEFVTPLFLLHPATDLDIAAYYAYVRKHIALMSAAFESATAAMIDRNITLEDDSTDNE